MFKHVDRDHSGGLSLDEFTRAVRREAKLPPVVLSDKSVQLLFDRLDADKTGTLSCVLGALPVVCVWCGDSDL